MNHCIQAESENVKNILVKALIREQMQNNEFKFSSIVTEEFQSS